MPEREGAAVGVYFFEGNAEFFGGGQGNRGEGFVDLEEVNVGESQIGLLERFLRGRDRSQQHDDGIAADDSGGNHAATGLKAMSLARRFRGEENRGGSID